MNRVYKKTKQFLQVSHLNVLHFPPSDGKPWQSIQYQQLWKGIKLLNWEGVQTHTSTITVTLTFKKLNSCDSMYLILLKDAGN